VKTVLKMKKAKELSRKYDLLQNKAKKSNLKNFKKKYNKNQVNMNFIFGDLSKIFFY